METSHDHGLNDMVKCLSQQENTDISEKNNNKWQLCTVFINPRPLHGYFLEYNDVNVAKENLVDVKIHWSWGPPVEPSKEQFSIGTNRHFIEDIQNCIN